MELTMEQAKGRLASLGLNKKVYEENKDDPMVLEQLRSEFSPAVARYVASYDLSDLHHSLNFITMLLTD